jgi:hypothetical protein
MKKKFIALIITIVTIIISAPKILAQEGKKILAYNSVKSSGIFSLFSEKKYFVETRLNDINIKAVRHFLKNYKDVNGEKWYKISDGFIADFTKDSIQTKVVYDLNGVWHCTLNAFDEKKMPSEVRDMVKTKYCDFNILIAYQIIYDEGVIFIIKIDSATKLKILNIVNGEMEVTGDYVKQ